MRSFLVQRPRDTALRALNYAPEIERIRRAGSSSATPLSAVLIGLGDSYWSVFTRKDCATESGVELLTQTDMFAAEPSGRVIRSDSMPNPDAHRVRRWQILLAGAGQMSEGNLFGRSIIADDRLTHGYLGPHAVALTFAEAGSTENLWTYAFLNSVAGLAAVKTAAFGTSVPGLRLDLLGTIPIPTAPPQIAERVARLIRSVVGHREGFLKNLRAARAEIELHSDVAEAHAMCATRSRRSVMWDGPFPTLSAWTFASTGGALQFLKDKWKSRLRDVVAEDGIFRGGRGARVPCVAPHGVDFLSQRDAFLIKPVPQRVLLPSHDLVPREGTVLVGGQGTLGEGEIFGRATVVSAAGAQSAWTEHLLRIVPRDGHSAWLFAYLTTTVGFRLLRSAAVGTKLLSMRTDLLLDLPVPDLPERTRKRVGEFVAASISAREAAESAEAQAIRIIDNEVLPQWLA